MLENSTNIKLIKVINTGVKIMCRIKNNSKNFDLIINGKIVKNFKSKASLNIYIREFEIRNYNIKEVYPNVRSKRLCS